MRNTLYFCGTSAFFVLKCIVETPGYTYNDRKMRPTRANNVLGYSKRKRCQIWGCKFFNEGCKIVQKIIKVWGQYNTCKSGIK